MTSKYVEDEVKYIVSTHDHLDSCNAALYKVEKNHKGCGQIDRASNMFRGAFKNDN